MSTETHVFFRGKLPSKAALARAMKELGFPFSLKPATGALEEQSGFMPMMLRQEETGVEFDVYDDRSAVTEFAAAGVDQAFERRASLRWGGDFEEAVAGMCVAAALARLVNGVVFDEAENKLLGVDDAIALARRNLETLQRPEEKPKFGTRPADIRRYLKPLLKQRKDLALLGRMLIIRPVRHLLRGVYFDRTSDKYAFNMWICLKPLYWPEASIGCGREVHKGSWKVWRPHFEAFLLDSLAEDFFRPVGEITTLEEFARSLEDDAEYVNTRYTARVLAGMCSLEQTHPVSTMEETLAKFHAWEAHTAKELKLGDIWQPAPFPVEVPETRRAAECSDPHFVTTPWVPRQAGLIQEVPEQPGQIRFATEQLWRQGRTILLVPLTREQAEEKHRARRDYVLVARLVDGNLLILKHSAHWNPYQPVQMRHPDMFRPRQFRLEVYGSSVSLHVDFAEDYDRHDVVRLESTAVIDRATGGALWHTGDNLAARERSINDYRSGHREYMRKILSDSDVALCEFDAPPFGEFGDFWRCVEIYLRDAGFGSFT